MARIRTIKPEFPQSETMGRVSRDARLLFIQIWTVCDDSGRARGNSRVLASLLYPYDDDARALLPGWLDELEDVHAIRRYVVGGDTYIEVCNWLKHQKIDKPSGAKCPSFDEGSPMIREGVASPPRGTGTGTGTGTTTTTSNGSCTAAAPPPARKPKVVSPVNPEWLADLKRAYPKRAGDARWAAACRAIHARLSEGHTLAEMLDSAKRYAAYCRAVGSEGTQFAKTAAVFFGPDKPFADAWELPTAQQQTGARPISPAERRNRGVPMHGDAA